MNIFVDKYFKNPLEKIIAFDNDSFLSAFSRIEKLRKEYYLLGYIRYEAKDIFLGRDIKSDLPFLYFEVYDKFETLITDDVEETFVLPEPSIDFERYESDILKIKKYISTGDTYEVNYTYDWNVLYPFDGIKLYKFLLTMQKTPYNAYIKNEYEEILSFSPELFFELKNNHIFTKPMKGTIKRGLSKSEDEANISFLKNDIKNRTENVMIVDLLRNDLSKIAKTGSVKVPKLFEIETHPTLHQMTSEVCAEVRADVTLFDIFEAIFPCGSITGAPKIRTMEIIDEIEEGKRNVYCGTIGLISPEKTVFSVPIRILQKTLSSDAFKYRSGGAVVWDSKADEEWDETIVKTSFLTSNHNNLKLIETVKVENGKSFLFENHMKRLKNSADKLGFKFNEDLYNIPIEKDGILRILLLKNGEFECEYKSLTGIPFDTVIVSPVKVNSLFPFLYHKTTFRPYYNNINEIFFNEKGELTENSIANIVIEKNNKMYTPPIECGLLNGVYRQKLLLEGKLIEKKLYLDDLRSADNIYCINSVRGMWRVKLCLS